MKMDGIDKSTGEIMKPYETPEHLDIKKIISRQIEYVNTNIKDPNDGEKIAKLSGDTMSLVLMELTAMYETLSRWLANEKLHVDDLKSAHDIKMANEYVAYKAEGETNETARMKAKIACQEELNTLNAHKHGLNIIRAWKKSIGRYHDAVRSQLSYEKSLSQMTR